MNRNSMTLTAVALGLALGTTAWSVGTSDSQKILSDLHHANQMEVQMGQLAKQKGSTDAVRNYGDELVKDHTDADQQVEALSQKDNIALLAPKMDDSKKMTDLSNKTGPAFDKAFVNEMVEDHKKDIAKLQKAEQTLPASDVRDLVVKLLPTLQQHLAVAQQIQKNS